MVEGGCLAREESDRSTFRPSFLFTKYFSLSTILRLALLMRFLSSSFIFKYIYVGSSYGKLELPNYRGET